PALPPWRNTFVVGYRALANWMAAFTLIKPFVVRGLPSGVVLGLCGSVVLLPAYTSWLQYDTASVRKPAASARTLAIRPLLSSRWFSDAALSSTFCFEFGMGL